MKKKHTGRLPGQMPPSEADQILQQQKQEKLSTMYGIFRCIFEQECIQLGVQEIAVLEYGEAGIQPSVKPRGFPEKQKDQRHNFMEQRLTDFHRMTKKGETSLVTEAIDALEVQVTMLRDMIKVADTPPKPEPAPLVGLDGLPLESKKDAGVLPSTAAARSDEGDTERAA